MLKQLKTINLLTAALVAVFALSGCVPTLDPDAIDRTARKATSRAISSNDAVNNATSPGESYIAHNDAFEAKSNAAAAAQDASDDFETLAEQKTESGDDDEAAEFYKDALEYERLANEFATEARSHKKTAQSLFDKHAAEINSKTSKVPASRIGGHSD